MNIASGGDEIPVELFQILKKRCYESAAFNMLANLENSAVATGLEKSLFHSNLKRRQCQKCFYYHTTALISQASKVMLKILQARLQQYMNRELLDVQVGFRKGRGTKDKITNIHWIIEKSKKIPEKNIYFCFIADDCNHEIKRCLLLGRKAMTNLDSILKSRNIVLLTKVI